MWIGNNKSHISRMEDLLSSLRRADRFMQITVLREMCELVTEVDAEGEKSVTLLLEHVTATENFEISVKLLSVVGHAAVTSSTLNGDDELQLAQHERVATCEGVYEAAARVLGKGLPAATVATLRCLTALCTGSGGSGGEGSGEGGGDARGALVARRARAHVRASGCLQAVVELFYRKNMYAETWRALCQCLVESCRDCEPNQTFCSRLVPTCVERAAAGSGGVGLGATLQLLLALVEGHAANRECFLNCGGLRLFTREVLVRAEGAILLSTVVQGHAPAARSAYSAGVPNTLTHLITAHGADSQVGKWCSIGLFHITSGLKILAKSNNHSPCDQNNTDFCNASILSRINLQQGDPEVLTNTLNQKWNQNGNQNKIQYQGKVMNQKSIQTNSTFKYEHMNMDKNVSTTSTIDNIDLELGKRIEAITNTLPVQHFAEIPYRSKDVRTDLCAPLQYQRIPESPEKIKPKEARNVSNYSQTTISSLPGGKCRALSTTFEVQSRVDKSCQTLFEETKCQISDTTNVQASFFNYNSSMSEFKPLAASTPRLSDKTIAFNINKHTHHRSDRKGSTRKCSYRNLQSALESSRHSFIPQRSPQIKNRYTAKINTHSDLIKSRAPVNKQAKTSLGSKLFNSINASYTSMVQSFKNYVLPEKTKDPDTKNVSRAIRHRYNKMERPHTDTSFMEYMWNRGRKAPKTTKPADYGEFDFSGLGESESVGGGEGGVGCITCNDTSLLQRKLASNEYLKDTVKKLKLGIKTYGCNFKKIANKYWPNEPFMTSAVLYDLYRKLIVKKTNK